MYMFESVLSRGTGIAGCSVKHHEQGRERYLQLPDHEHQKLENDYRFPERSAINLAILGSE